MAENEQRRTRAKAWTAEIDAARRRAGFMLPAGLADRAAWLGRLLSQWAVAEVAPGRLLPWLPVAFDFGIVAYFTADREPAWWAASSADARRRHLCICGAPARIWFCNRARLCRDRR